MKSLTLSRLFLRVAMKFLRKLQKSLEVARTAKSCFKRQKLLKKLPSTIRIGLLKAQHYCE